MSRRFAATLGAAILLSACDPDDVPRLSPDAKKIALLLDLGKDTKKDNIPLGIADLETGKTSEHVLPDGYSATGFVWVGGRVLVGSSRPKSEKSAEGKPTHDFIYWLLDPVEGKFTRTPLKPHLKLSPFVAKHKGRACIYAPQLDPEGTRIFALDDLSEQHWIPRELEHAGDGWTIYSENEETRGGLTRDLVGVDVLDPEGLKVCRIPREEIAKACHRDARFPECARISSNHQRIVLGFDTSTIFRQAPTEYTFGVYDLRDGKFLWGGGSNCLHGLPVLSDDAVYALEAKSRSIYVGERTPAALVGGSPPRSQHTSEVVLGRHTKAGRTVVLEVPLKKEDLAARYSASEDRTTFVLLVEGKNPRLLVVPIKEKLDAAQVREIPLK